MVGTAGKQRIVIVGGGYAGLMAAARIGRTSRANVTLVDAQPAFAQRIRFHEALAGTTLKSFDYGPALAQRGINFVQGWIDTLDSAQGRVTGRAASGTRLELGYDTVVLALGSSSHMAVPGVAEHTLRLDSLTAIQRASRQLRALAQRNGRVLLVGGGLTSIETAAELAERFPTLQITLVDQGRLGADYSPKGQAHLVQSLAHRRIALREQTAIVGVDAGQAWCAEGEAIPFDLCIWCAGFVAPALARNAGLPVDTQGRVVVDSTLRVATQPNVFAVGDAAAVRLGEQFLRMGCVTAMPMGAYVGDTIRQALHGEPSDPFKFNFVLRCLSLGRSEGLVQFTRPDDATRAAIWSGRRAVYTKEAICRMTYAVVRNELRTGLRLYRWDQRN